MPNQAPARRDGAAPLEQVIMQGDLGDLDADGRMAYVARVCESLGLNPYTRPFEYLRLNGKLVLYARRDATDQLRNLRHVTVQITSRERIEDVYVVTARATMPDGRTDESVGAVSIGNARGDALANLLMKCETKAKRRVTLSICGLGFLDETETETIPHTMQVSEQAPRRSRQPAAPAIAAEASVTGDPGLHARSLRKLEALCDDYTRAGGLAEHYLKWTETKVGRRDLSLLSVEQMTELAEGVKRWTAALTPPAEPSDPDPDLEAAADVAWGETGAAHGH